MLAAARKPPVNTTAGTPYNHEYSGGSLGPVIRKLQLEFLGYELTLEHIEHALGDDEAPRNIHTGKKNR